MRTSTILFLLLFLIHTTTMVNITVFDGEWNGIALMISNILFLVAAIYYGSEYRARKGKE
ncbi:hypothetical protein [Thalassobacillus hwangdonensis]|uniref:Uncharacterized protein n=1 Tax=Thalassobacillus hwangdonensis TaxID=546108 RepID=A0ABW3L1H7_9BACI